MLFNSELKMITEEAFILPSLKEFVKAWGSGSQASFNIVCKQEQAFLNMSSLLGHPTAGHFVPAHAPGPHDHVEQSIHKRRQCPSRMERNRARAADAALQQVL